MLNIISLLDIKMLNKIIYRCLLFSIFALMLGRADVLYAISAKSGEITGCDGDGACISARDFGIGGFICVPAGISENYQLVQETPKSRQIAKWIDTGLYTLGNPPSSDPGSQDQGSLRIMVNGGWNPWGHVNGVEYDLCDLKDCDPANTTHGVCINKAEDVGKVVDDSNLDKLPCLLQASEVGAGSTGGGWGLYGLIAISKPDNSTSDPNDRDNATTLPPSSFRTFRISPLEKGDQVNNPDAPENEQFEYYFDLKYTQKCSAETGCIKDKYLGNGPEYIVRGKLYLKILDSYYQDNSGSYLVSVVKGVYSPKGFIETTVGNFQSKIIHIVESLTDNVIKDSGFLSLVQTIILLYVTVTGAMFVLGMVEINNKELLIRGFKVVVVSVLLSEQSWNFFTQEVFGAFQQTIESLGDMVIRTTLFYDDGMPIYQMPNTATPLSVYDLMLSMVTGLPVHAKTLSMLFYRWKLYWIPAIYICIAFIIISILRSLVLYLIMFMQMGLLLLIAPIFLITLLFETTKDLFEGWLKQLISTGMIYVMIAVTIALMMKIVVGQLEEMLAYRVCWKSVWKLNILWIEVFDLKFWYPSYDSEVDAALNGLNFLKFMIVSVLFFGLMSEIPRIADVLGGSSRFATDDMFSRTHGAATGIFNNVISKINRLNPMGYALSGTLITKGLDKFRDKRGDFQRRGAISLITPPGRGPRGIMQSLKEDWKPLASAAMAKKGSDIASSENAPDSSPDKATSEPTATASEDISSSREEAASTPDTHVGRDSASGGSTGGGAGGHSSGGAGREGSGPSSPPSSSSDTFASRDGASGGGVSGSDTGSTGRT